MNENIYGIQYKDGQLVKLTGKSFQEAYSQNGRKTKDGNIDFSILDFFFRVPVPHIENTDQYQIFLLRNKKSNWESFGKPNYDFNLLEELMKERKVKREGFLSGIVVRMSDEKIMSWCWA